MVLGTQAQVLFILSTVALFDVGLSVECSHMTNTREWSLYVVCWDKSQRPFDKCQWDVVSKTNNNRIVSPQTSPSSEKFFNCSGKLPLPLSTGVYSYHLLLPKQTWHYILNLRTKDPGELTLKNCPREVSEGDNVTCICSTQRDGRPPPVISWTGQTTSSTLHLYEVTGEHNKTYTCEMIWGKQTKTVSYSLLVRDTLKPQEGLDDTRKLTLYFTRGRHDTPMASESVKLGSLPCFSLHTNRLLFVEKSISKLSA